MANNRDSRKAEYYDPATAPFNFVRLPRIAVDRYNSESELPAHNRIYREEDGYYSGEVAYEIAVDEKDPASVLMIGDDSAGGEKKFFRNNDGKCTIPGSTVRGMVRNNVQILGMCNPKKDIQDSRFMYRKMAASDGKLQKIYRAEIGAPQNKTRIGRAEPGKVAAGYMERISDDEYVIYPAKLVKGRTYYRISERKLMNWVGNAPGVNYMRNGRSFRPYVVENASFNLDASGVVTEVSFNQVLKYNGYLTTAGYMQSKQAHYLINEPDKNSPERIVLKKKGAEITTYVDDFERKKQLRNKSFYMLPKKGEMKPVFYVRTENFTYFGVTPYLRIAYKHTVHDGISQKLDTAGVNYSDALFGYTVQSDRKTNEVGYRARVNFSDAVSEDAKIGKERRILLGEPKATCYPEYLVQTDRDNLMSYADRDFRIRGIKQYWLINRLRTYEGGNEKVSTSIKPVESGTFCGKIYFENLAEDELGLLLYALYLEEDAYQNIGMGKPYGYGKVKIRNIRPCTYDYRNMYTGNFQDTMRTLDTEALIESYKKYMKGRGVDVDSEKNVQELLYMKTHVLKKAETEYQDFRHDFKDNRILPEILNYEAKIKKYLGRRASGGPSGRGNSGQENHQQQNRNRPNYNKKNKNR